MTNETESAFEQARSALPNREHVLHDMSVIDAKSSALLTHVSIMIAVVAVFLGQPNSPMWTWVFTVELSMFSIVAMFLLRCIDIMGPPLRQLPEGGEVVAAHYRHEILVRRGVLQWMIRIVQLITVAVIATVLLKARLVGPQ